MIFQEEKDEGRRRKEKVSCLIISFQMTFSQGGVNPLTIVRLMFFCVLSLYEGYTQCNN